MAFTEEEMEDFVQAIRITASMSLVGSLSVLAFFRFHPKRRQFWSCTANRILFFLSLSDLLRTPGHLLSRDGYLLYGEDSALCIGQGFLLLYTGLMTIMWTLCLAVNVLLTIEYRMCPVEISKFEKCYYILCYGVTAVWAGILFLPPLQYQGTHIFGNADTWCWISGDYPEYRLYLFFVPIWVVFLLLIAIYGAVGRTVYLFTVRSSSNIVSLEHGQGFVKRDEMKAIYRRYTIKATMYILAFFLSWTPNSITRVYSMTHGGESLYYLTLLQSITVPLKGFLNALVFFSYVQFLGMEVSASGSTNKDYYHSPDAQSGRFQGQIASSREGSTTGDSAFSSSSSGSGSFATRSEVTPNYTNTFRGFPTTPEPSSGRYSANSSAGSIPSDRFSIFSMPDHGNISPLESEISTYAPSGLSGSSSSLAPQLEESRTYPPKIIRGVKI